MATVCSTDDPDGLARRLAGRRRLALAGIVLFSVAVRVAFFFELNQGPCIWLHRWDQTDMNFFDEWAKVIAAGDWLTDRKFVPDHGWYRMIGDAFLKEHPELRAEIEREAAADGVSPSRAVWNRWYGKRFHQDPLYPYLLALHYRVLGEDHRFLFVWQLLGGVGTNVLVYLIARRCFGEAVGAAAGVLACLCSTLLFYELVLLRESLIVFAGLALAYAGDLLRDRGGFRSWFFFGVGFGLASLLKNVFLPFWLLYLAGLGWQRRRFLGLWIRAAGGGLLGIAMGLSPVFARNLAVGAPVLGLAGTGGVTFISTNAADVSEGIQMGGPVSFAHLPRIMGLTAGRPWPTILETLKTHPSVGSYLNLLWSKFGMLWRWFEAPDNCNLYHFQLFSAVLRFLPVTFFLLSPLAMTGLVLALPRFSRCWPLYLYVVSLAALLMVFCPLSRWRLPMVAAVIPLAGLTTVSIGQWLVSGQLGRGCAALLAVTLIALWTSRPLPPGVPPVRPADCTGSFQAYYLPEAERAWRAGDLPRVIALFSDFVQHEPGAVKRLDAARPAQSVLEAQLAQLYAEARMELADLLLRAGRKKAAALHQQRAGELFRAAPNWR